METFNKFFVGVNAGNSDVVFLRPVPLRVSREDALLLAAYIVSMADPIGEDFSMVLKAVQET